MDIVTEAIINTVDRKMNIMRRGTKKRFVDNDLINIILYSKLYALFKFLFNNFVHNINSFAANPL
jgi:hypothetical protein